MKFLTLIITILLPTLAYTADGLCSKYSESLNDSTIKLACSNHHMICPGQQNSTGACYFRKEYYIHQSTPGAPRTVIRTVCHKKYSGIKEICTKKIVLNKSKDFDKDLHRLAKDSCRKYKNSPRSSWISQFTNFLFFTMDVIDDSFLSALDFTTETFCENEINTKYDLYFKLKSKYDQFSGPDQKLFTRDLDILFCLSNNC